MPRFTKGLDGLASRRVTQGQAPKAWKNFPKGLLVGRDWQVIEPLYHRYKGLLTGFKEETQKPREAGVEGLAPGFL